VELVRRIALRHPDGRPVEVRELPSSRALLGERVAGERFVMTSAQGGERWVSLGAAPLVVGGEVRGAVAIWHDMTERERLVQRIQRSAAQLDITVGRLNGLIQDREAYMHTISHDLRAPLTVILGQAGIAMRSAERADLVRRSATAILTAARRMNVMIQDLVDSARLESGQLRLERAPVDLRQFLHEYIERSASVMPTDRIGIHAPAGLPRVYADSNRLERILTNLLSNAVKYSDPNTEITVTLERNGDEILASVTDRGRGIPPNVLPRLFERYFRSRDTSERHEGLGLGLFITRGLVEAHGGHIWVESAVGVGSTFRFTLPVCVEDRARE
jgi:signal transduction histidine kinase